MAVDLNAIRAEYPYTPKSLDLGGQRISYLDEGPPHAPVVAMLHGNPTWSFYFRHLVRALRPRYRVIVPDHMGCGLSDRPRGYEYTLRRRIDDFGALVHHLGLRRLSLAVHDWGGAIGFGFATRNPGMIETLTVMNTAAFRSERMPWRIRVCGWPLIGELALLQGNMFLRAAIDLRMATATPERFTSAVREGYFAPYGSPWERAAIMAFVRDIPMKPGHPSYETLTDIEDRLYLLADKPMTLIWGMRDWCFDSHILEGWTSRFPDADLVKIEDAGHFVCEDAPERVIAAMEPMLEKVAR